MRWSPPWMRPNSARWLDAQGALEMMGLLLFLLLQLPQLFFIIRLLLSPAPLRPQPLLLLLPFPLLLLALRLVLLSSLLLLLSAFTLQVAAP